MVHPNLSLSRSPPACSRDDDHPTGRSSDTYLDENPELTSHDDTWGTDSASIDNDDIPGKTSRLVSVSYPEEGSGLDGGRSEHECIQDPSTKKEIKKRYELRAGASYRFVPKSPFGEITFAIQGNGNTRLDVETHSSFDHLNFDCSSATEPLEVQLRVDDQGNKAVTGLFHVSPGASVAIDPDMIQS